MENEGRKLFVVGERVGLLLYVNVVAGDDELDAIANVVGNTTEGAKSVEFVAELYGGWSTDDRADVIDAFESYVYGSTQRVKVGGIELTPLSVTRDSSGASKLGPE